MIFLKSSTELDTMDRANRLVHRVLGLVREHARPGASTADLDELAERTILDGGGVPAFKGYRGFPATLCTSINDVIVHGIPSRAAVLAEGDVVSVDCGVLLNGFYGDAAVTFGVGEVSHEAERLMKTTPAASKSGPKIGLRLTSCLPTPVTSRRRRSGWEQKLNTSVSRARPSWVTVAEGGALLRKVQ